jgi:uncharacterized protein YfkK (UPF0435 family)
MYTNKLNNQNYNKESSKKIDYKFYSMQDENLAIKAPKVRKKNTIPNTGVIKNKKINKINIIDLTNDTEEEKNNKKRKINQTNLNSSYGYGLFNKKFKDSNNTQINIINPNLTTYQFKLSDELLIKTNNDQQNNTGNENNQNNNSNFLDSIDLNLDVSNFDYETLLNFN